MSISKKMFIELLRSGSTSHSGFLSVRFICTKGTNKAVENKFSFVVSSRVAKLATMRNLLKRRGRAIINKHKNEIVGPLVCAFFFKAGSEQLNYSELEQEIMMILRRSQLIK